MGGAYIWNKLPEVVLEIRAITTPETILAGAWKRKVYSDAGQICLTQVGTLDG